MTQFQEPGRPNRRALALLLLCVAVILGGCSRTPQMEEKVYKGPQSLPGTSSKGFPKTDPR